MSTGVAIKPKKEALPHYATLVKLDLDWWAQDHKDVTLWSETSRGSAGCWGLEHRPPERNCKSFSSLEKKREKEIAWEGEMAIWDWRSTDGASLPLEVCEISERGNRNSLQHGQFTPYKELVCKKS
ncbi:hypothetical protein DUI87_33153 [Hirundo rustica rustica]|uniref:Uncharacterized protein n=1 Tax=Hirundo rustica rustica TaxID=333673 RepID=A0A3M0IPP9_HIRRU|nr:hypothetical protein DUI87_33153 [Hirundo rustica rustica]